MKITFEVGDHVTVEDNMDASDIPAADVQLVEKVSDTKWKVKTTWDSSFYPPNKEAVVDEKHFEIR